MIILMLPLISRTILQTFRCVKYNEDDKFTPVLKVLFVDQSVDCKKSSYALMKHYAILNVLIWPVGVPIGLMIWLSTVAKYLDPPNVSEEQAIQERNSNEHIKNSAIAFLALKYKPRYWYYEIIFSLTRRLVLTCVVLVFDTRGGFILFVLFVSILTTVCEREMDAFIDPYLGSFVYLMSWQTLLCMLAMLIMDAEMTSDVGDVSVGVTLLLLNVLMMVFVFVETKGNVKRGNTERMSARFEIEAFKKAQRKTKPSGVRNLWEKVLGHAAAGDAKANRVMPVLSHEGKVDDDADFDGNSSDEFESKDDTMEMSNEKSGGKQQEVRYGNEVVRSNVEGKDEEKRGDVAALEIGAVDLSLLDEEDEFEDFLDRHHLESYAEAIHEYGIMHIADLYDEDILSDNDLAESIGMSKAEIDRFRSILSSHPLE